MKRWKTLYKKTATGKIQQWKIWVKANQIFTEYGQVGGKQITAVDAIKVGKNIGKKTETTKEEQAIAEARSRYIKQKKKGYVNQLDDAELGKVDKVIAGGFVPMTAKSFDSAGRHIVYPCAVQPKLDGIRACRSGGKFYTRTRKPIGSVPHIAEAFDKIGLRVAQIPFDGELYNHDYKEDFEVISSSVRREKELHPDHKLIQYHIYDVNIDGTFAERLRVLTEWKSKLEATNCIKIVETRVVHDYKQLSEAYDEFLEMGYEGAMVRNLESPYESKRSKHLQKMKIFQDGEFKIIDIIEGRGKLRGHVGSFVCQIEDTFYGKRIFRAKAEGKLENLKRYFENKKLWKGKWLTVRYQNISKKKRVPRFPVGVRIRDMDY